MASIPRVVTINCKEHHQKLTERLWNSFKSKRGVDFDLVCGGRTIGVHRFLLDLFLSSDKLRQTAGALQQKPNEDCAVLESLLQFLYTGQLTVAKHRLDTLQKVASDADFGLLLDCLRDAELGEEYNGDDESTICEPELEGIFLREGFVEEFVSPTESLTNHTRSNLAETNQVISNPPNEMTTNICDVATLDSSFIQVVSESPLEYDMKVEPELLSSEYQMIEVDTVHSDPFPEEEEESHPVHYELISKFESVNESDPNAPIQNQQNGEPLNQQTTNEIPVHSITSYEDEVLVTTHLTTYAVSPEPSTESFPPPGFECPFCGQLFSSQAELSAHATVHAGQRTRKRRKFGQIGGQSLSDGPPFKCDMCKKSFTRRDRLKIHQFASHKFNPKVKTALDFSCQVPTNKFRTQRKQNSPPDQNKLDLPSGTETPITIDLIQTASTSQPLGLDNSSTKTTSASNAHSKSYKCHVCNSKFERVSLLENHMSEHADVLPFACEDCSKRFFDEGSLRVHIRNHHTGPRQFKCPVCDKDFLQAQQLSGHMNAHTSENLYNNESDVLLLQQHLLNQDADKRYECGVCQKRFPYKSHLNRHFVTHTTEKLYKCTLCPKEFRVQTTLDRHLSQHATNVLY